LQHLFRQALNVLRNVVAVHGAKALQAAQDEHGKGSGGISVFPVVYLLEGCDGAAEFVKRKAKSYSTALSSSKCNKVDWV
jgi:hypothetical protein